MKKILIPYFEINGRASYPDDSHLFSNPELRDISGAQYWQFDYKGDLSLEGGAHTYESALQEATAVIEIVIDTMTWLREHMTSAVELTVRQYADSTATHAPSLKAFMRMVDVRERVGLIVSDTDYPAGPALMYAAGLVDLAHATYLIELGGHDASVYLS